jgi:hypothetical protein
VNNHEESDMERASSECEEANHLAGRCARYVNRHQLCWIGSKKSGGSSLHDGCSAVLKL